MPRALTAVLAAVLLAGCGGGSDDAGSAGTAIPTGTPTPPATATPSPTSTPGPEDLAVAAALRRYAAAVRAGDADTICRKLLARDVLERVKASGGSCTRNLVAPRIEEGGPDYGIVVRSISVQGDRAVAEITATERDGARESRQPLVREGGSWRLGVG